MGNESSAVVPQVIKKNWQLIQPCGTLYRNKLTSQCVRQHKIKIAGAGLVEQFKRRMKQSNPYICRLVFYFQYNRDTCYAYTEQNLNQPFVQCIQKWKFQKQNIVQAFITLAKRYKPTRVCRQMIKANQTGQIKIWINPDPIKSQAWSPCNSQSQMISDILDICKNLAQQSSLMKKKKLIKQFNQRNAKLNENQFYLKSNLKQSLTESQINSQFKIKNNIGVHSHLKIHQKHANIIDRRQKYQVNQLKPKQLSKANQLNRECLHLNISQVSELSFGQNLDIWDRTKTETFNGMNNPSRSFKKYQMNPLALSDRLKNITCHKVQYKIPQFKLNIDKQLIHLKRLRKNNSLRSHVRSESKLKQNKSQGKFPFQKFKKTSMQKKKQTQRHFNFHHEKQQTFSCRTTCQITPRKQNLDVKNVDKKLSSKLVDVTCMPVRQQRESQLTFIDPNENHRRMNKVAKKEEQVRQSVNLSQQLNKFFNQSILQQDGVIKEQFENHSAQYQVFQDEVNKLLGW